MLTIAEGIPGQPHKWAAEIKHWADGGLVQWRYTSEALPAWAQVKDIESPWRDSHYANAGMPNWMSGEIVFRIAPGGNHG